MDIKAQSYRFFAQLWLGVAVACVSAPLSWAQSSSVDNSWRDTELKGTDHVYGAQSEEAIPHKRTKKGSPLVIFNEHIYTSIMDPDAPQKVYNGNLYRDPPNSPRIVHSMIGYDDPEASDSQRYAACQHMIEPRGGIPDEPNAAYNRLRMDNCANQYLLNAAMQPDAMDGRLSNLRAGDGNEAREVQENFCQPFEIKRVPNEYREYDPGTYIKDAWKRLLRDPKHKKNMLGILNEPDYSYFGTLKMVSKMDMPSGSGPSWDELHATNIEQIIDPVHPFSPRWNYFFNDRDHFSPLTQIYSGDDEHAVRCSGTKDEEIKVDLLEFRFDDFAKDMGHRIAFNTLCYNNMIIPPPPCYLPPYITLTCRECVDVMGGDFRNEKPPCATIHDGEDIPLFSFLCGKSAEKICYDAAKPVVPINKLRIRHTDDLPEGSPEGYEFEDYFENRRPYMRWLDTGTEATDPNAKFDWYSDENSKVAIVGVGQEEGAKDSMRCMLGGGSGIPASGIVVPPVDPISSWAEMKLYQARTVRKYGLNCLARHEKLYKPFGTEDHVLQMAGAEYEIEIEENGLKTRRSVPFPLGWRGYCSDPNASDQFPRLNNTSGYSLIVGLDNALPGDIILLPNGSAGLGGRPGLCTAAYVTQAQTKAVYDGDTPPNGEWVVVSEADWGKMPDVCGVTDASGMVTTRSFYKKLPKNFKEGLDEIGAPTTECTDTNLKYCHQKQWGNLKIYRPYNDIRE
mgnify:FL=1